MKWQDAYFTCSCLVIMCTRKLSCPSSFFWGNLTLPIFDTFDSLLPRLTAWKKPQSMERYLLFSAVSHFSLSPLFFVWTTSLVTFALQIGFIFASTMFCEKISQLSNATRVALLLIAAVASTLDLLRMVPILPTLPFFPTMMISTLSAFSLVWIWCYPWQK